MKLPDEGGPRLEVRVLRGVCMSVRVLWGGGECSGVEYEIVCNEHSLRWCGKYSVDLLTLDVD